MQNILDQAVACTIVCIPSMNFAVNVQIKVYPSIPLFCCFTLVTIAALYPELDTANTVKRGFQCRKSKQDASLKSTIVEFAY